MYIQIKMLIVLPHHPPKTPWNPKPKQKNQNLSIFVIYFLSWGKLPTEINCSYKSCLSYVYTVELAVTLKRGHDCHCLPHVHELVLAWRDLCTKCILSIYIFYQHHTEPVLSVSIHTLCTHPPPPCVWIATDTRCRTISGFYTVPLLSFPCTHSCSFSTQSVVSGLCIALCKIQKYHSSHFGQWGCRNVSGLTSSPWKNSRTNILDIRGTHQVQGKCLVPS